MQILAEGQSIRHIQYGMGVVTQSNSERTTIDFDEFGTKKFVTSIWSAEVVGEPPTGPVRPRAPPQECRKNRRESRRENRSQGDGQSRREVTPHKC